MRTGFNIRYGRPTATDAEASLLLDAGNMSLYALQVERAAELAQIHQQIQSLPEGSRA